MKKILPILLIIIFFIILIFACENRKDPFSAMNSAPKIENFAFEKTSLKITEGPFDFILKYSDNEQKQLTATFIYKIGNGTVFHTKYEEKSTTDSSVTFNVPDKFNSSNDQPFKFIPDTTGEVTIKLKITDGVKIAEDNATTIFFDNLSPVAVFTYELLTDEKPYDVKLDASGCYDPDSGKIEAYYWDFGDTETDTGAFGDAEITHSYSSSGIFTVKLKVEDDEGAVNSIEHSITTPNMSPLASLQVEPPFGEAPLTINYTATNSFDPDGEIISYRVSFGDGENSADSAGTHTYNYDKDYQIELTVEDNLGYTHSASTEIKVATSPVAVLKITPIEGPFPLECLIDGTASADSQGGKLEHDIYINNQLEYDNIDNIIHTFDAPEQYLVRLVVTSQRNGLTDAAHQSVTVINIDPNADFSWEPPFPQHQTPVTYTSTSIDSNLTDEITYYKWTFPSGLIKQGADSAIVHQAFDAGVDSYKVKLEVWDKYGGEGFIEKIVTKSN